MSTLNNLNDIQTVPDINALIDLDFNNISFQYIVGNILFDLNDCIKDNDKILDEKNSKGHIGLKLMKYGVISTVIFIIYIVIILV